MAVIEVSEESLRLIAGDEVLGQAAGTYLEDAPDELRESLARAQAAAGYAKRPSLTERFDKAGLPRLG